MHASIEQPLGQVSAQGGKDIAAMLRNDRLPNGFRLYHVHRPHTKSVSMALAFPFGSAHEPREKRGITHLLEHVMLRGSEKISQHQLRREFDRRGGWINGQTWHELLCFEATLPAKHLAFALEALREVVFAPELSPESLQSEKDVIKTEPGFIRRAWIYKARRALRRWGLVGSPGHVVEARVHNRPEFYEPIAGFASTVRSIRHDELTSLYHERIAPGSAALIMVGDVPWEQAHSMADELFSSLAPKPFTLAAPVCPHPLRLPSQHSLIAFSPRPTITMDYVFPFGGQSEPDYAALHVLAFLIRGILFDELRIHRGLIYDIYSYPEALCQNGILRIELDCPHGARQKIDAWIQAKLDELAAGIIDEQEFEDARNACHGSFQVWMQSLDAHMEWIVGHLHAIESPWVSEWPNVILRVELDQVKQAAGHLLRADNRLCVMEEMLPSWLISRLGRLALAPRYPKAAKSAA